MFRVELLVVVALVISASSARVCVCFDIDQDYNGAELLRVTPTTAQQLEFLKRLHEQESVSVSQIWL